ncbi:N-acyl homoserine lactonase family protein [Microbacterium rhizophilus]|uniref:N-acyl homoserine lactonase family protein n=1 Tax=Microbacterium rhizophilus TaxID=3138934 RepID=UPI0031F01502
MTRGSVHAGDNTVIAVRHGDWHTTRSHVFLNYADLGEPDAAQTVAYYFWVILGPERTIVVDTGFGADAATRRGRDVLVPPAEAWVGLGLDRDAEIDLVLTHAHYDHIGNVAWFRRAAVYMARAEYEFWAGPAADAPSFRGLVEADELAHLRELHASGRLRLLDSELTLAPGVELIAGPGHTPGELMVRVETSDGVALLTSDAVHFDEELARDMPFRHMCDLVSAHDTFRRIRALASGGEIAHVITGHDPSISTRFPPLKGALNRHAVVIGGVPTGNGPVSIIEGEVSRDH